jgi:hypothetical protein
MLTLYLRDSFGNILLQRCIKDSKVEREVLNLLVGLMEEDTEIPDMEFPVDMNKKDWMIFFNPS